jgi:hypothetical protein
MARSYTGLANMAARFGFRLAKARQGSQHLGMPVRYLLEDKNGVLPFRSLEDVERKLSATAQERAQRKAAILQKDTLSGAGGVQRVSVNTQVVVALGCWGRPPRALTTRR